MMKRQVMSLLLVSALAATLLPLAAFAQEQPDIREEELCEHTDTERIYEFAGDWLHAVTEQCACGEEVGAWEEGCLDEDTDSFCDLCEGELPCLHSDTSVTYQPGQKAESHIAVTLCSCGEKVNAQVESCEDADSNGFCDGCAAQLENSEDPDGDGCAAQLEEPITLGDVTFDGVIDGEDVNLVLCYVARLQDDINEAMADVDGNGRVTAVDAMLILCYAQGQIDAFPGEQ